MADILVFVPRVGFRWANALGTSANVVATRDGMTFVGAIAPDRDGCRLSFTVTGIALADDLGPMGRRLEEPVLIHDDRGRDISRSRPRWWVGGWLRRQGDASVTLNYGTVLDALLPDVRHVVVEFDGPAGEWRVELPVRPARLTGPAGRALDTADSRHGITIAARTLARMGTTTAIELEAFYDPPEEQEDPRLRRRVRGIGQSLHAGRLCGDQVVLRDERGDVHFEQGQPCPDHTGGKHRETVTFATLPQDARAGVLEIEYVWVSEPSDTVTVPLPGETDITVAGCDGHVVVSRLAGTDGAGRIRVECAPRDPDAERQLAFMEGVDAERAARIGMTVTHCVGQRPVVEIAEPTGEATEVTLSAPVIQLRGPWRLPIPLA